MAAAPDAHRVIGTRPHLAQRFEEAAVLSCSARDFARLQRYALSCARALRRRCSTSSTGLNRKTARSSPAVSRSAVTCRLAHGAPLHAAMHHQCHRQHCGAPCLKRVSAFGSEERRLAPGAVTPRRYMHRNAIWQLTSPIVSTRRFPATRPATQQMSSFAVFAVFAVLTEILRDHLDLGAVSLGCP